jgi:hypothetical protein
VIRAAYRRLAIAALAVLAGCATSQLVSQKVNPDYVGKPLKRVMVVAVTEDEITRRTYEDRVIALLGKRGIEGIAGYSAVGKRGKVEEAELRQAIARSGVEGVMITRVTSVEQSKIELSGTEVAVGYGWGGFYGYYAGVWTTVSAPPRSEAGQRFTVSETRLFDARNGALAWTGIVGTKESDDFNAALTQYIEVIFDAMVGDRVI